MITPVRTDMEPFSNHSGYLWSMKTRRTSRTGEAARIVSKLHISDTQATEVKPDMLSGRGAQMDNHL